MKIIVTTVALATFLAVDSRADLAYSAPGMDSYATKSGLTVSETVDLGDYWKYQVTGIKWRLVAATPDGGFVRTNGNLVKGDGKSSFTGHSSMSVSVNGTVIIPSNSANLTCDHITDYIDGDLDFEPIVIDEGSVSVVFNQSTNMIGDAGSYAVVKGIGLRQAPGPVGTITATSKTGSSDEYCSLNWTISRSDGMDETIDIPDTEVEFVVTSPDKGHGNNVDGVDSDNTGKATQAWNDRNGILAANDAELFDGDEGGSGGSFVAKGKK
jgi:hypothetical protein